jgi:hypothetical protein
MRELLDALKQAEAGIAPGRLAEKSATETVQSSSHRGSGAIEAGREPGMPLARLACEAPRHSLAIAFLLGVAVARR